MEKCLKFFIHGPDHYFFEFSATNGMVRTYHNQESERNGPVLVEFLYTKFLQPVSLSEPSFAQSAFQNEPDLRVRQGLTMGRSRWEFESSLSVIIISSSNLDIS